MVFRSGNDSDWRICANTWTNEMEHISSASNNLIKHIIRLEKKRERFAQKQIVVEGIREIIKLSKSGIQPIAMVLNEHWQGEELQNFTDQVAAQRVVTASDDVFRKICYREGVANAVAICPMPSTSLEHLQVPGNPLIIILEALEKPGNIGAIFRSADAAGADAVILANPLTDAFNPNIIRASLGTLFSVPFAEADNESVHAWLRKHSFQIISTYLEANQSPYGENLDRPTAIVMGTEATGISDFWINHSDALVKIPMHGEADSMNVSTSAAVILYEAVRQRLDS